MPIYTIDTLTSKYTIPGETDNVMPTLVLQPQEQEAAYAEPIVIIRPSFKKICDGEPCRAALFNHILYWIARKRKQGIDYWYSTGDGLYHDLDESWGVTQVRREVKALINSNLIGVMKNPRMAIDRTKHFFFHAAQATVFFAKCVTEKICFCCIGLAKEVIDLLNAHLIDLLNAHPNDEAFDKSINCLCPKHQGHLIELSKPFDKSIKAITQVSYSGEDSVIPNESVSEDISSANADDALPPYEDGYKGKSPLSGWLADITLMDEAFLAEIGKKLSTSSYPPVDTPYHIAPTPTSGTVTTSLSAIGDEGEAYANGDAHSAGHRAGVPRFDTFERAASGNSGADSGRTGQATRSAREKIEAAPSQEQPHALQATLQGGTPSLSTQETGKRRGSKKVVNDESITVPQMPADDAPWTTRTVMQLFDARRGVVLIGKHKNMQASECAKGLATHWTRAQVMEAIERMEKDKYYRERGIGVDICDVGHNIHKFVKRDGAPVKRLTTSIYQQTGLLGPPTSEQLHMLQ